LANLFYRRRVFGLNGDETVGNNGPEKEGDSWTLGEVTAFLGAHVFAPIDGPKLVERAKDLVRQRHDHVLDLLRHLAHVDLARGLGSMEAKRGPEEHARANLQSFNHRQLSTVDFVFVFRIKLGHCKQNLAFTQIPAPSNFDRL